jgi:hypothetical protein
MRKINIILGAAVAAALVLVANPATASVVTAGASGQCFGAEGQGGQDATRITLDTEARDPVSILLLSVTGAVGALQQFAAGTIASPPPADACANEGALDYLEADAAVDGTGAQVCYVGNEAPEPVVVNADGPAGNPCPTYPTGPGG